MIVPISVFLEVSILITHRTGKFILIIMITITHLQFFRYTSPGCGISLFIKLSRTIFFIFHIAIPLSELRRILDRILLIGQYAHAISTVPVYSHEPPYRVIAELIRLAIWILAINLFSNFGDLPPSAQQAVIFFRTFLLSYIDYHLFHTTVKNHFCITCCIRGIFTNRY